MNFSLAWSLPLCASQCHCDQKKHCDQRFRFHAGQGGPCCRWVHLPGAFHQHIQAACSQHHIEAVSRKTGASGVTGRHLCSALEKASADEWSKVYGIARRTLTPGSKVRARLMSGSCQLSASLPAKFPVICCLAMPVQLKAPRQVLLALR